jgi:toxin-antitoxin system PIN domain toxin
VIIIDANILLYAYNRSASQHPKAQSWLEEALSGSETIGLPWAIVLAFLRIGTNPRAFPQPLSMSEAVAIVSEWFAQPVVRIIEPTDRHWALLAAMLPAAQVKGPLVTDAHLATLAIEHGATLYSTDSDFSRFPRLRWRNPIATSPGAASEGTAEYEIRRP